MRRLAISVTLISLLFSLAGGQERIADLRMFDEFGDVRCEDEMARLDNIAIQLQNMPDSKAVLVFFGGRMLGGKLPRRGDAAARATRLKPYLVSRRGIPFNRVMVFDGGYADVWHVEVWIVPLDFWFPAPQPGIPATGVKFRRGKSNPRDFRCRI